MKKKIILLVPLLLVVLAVYGPSFQGQFIWDDRPLIVNNPLVKDLRSLPQIFVSELHLGTSTNYYRPLSTATFMADYFFFGLRPLGYHVTNVVLHYLACSLFFLFLCEVTPSLFVAFGAGLLFAVLPVHTAAVAYIAGRADPLSAVFIFSSLLFYVSGWRRRGTGLEKLCSFFSLVFFLGALLTKENALVFPLIILGLEIFLVRSDRKFIRVLPFIVITLIYCFLRAGLLNFSGGHPLLAKKGFAFFEIGFFSRIEAFAKTLAIYAGGLLMPIGLHMERLLPFEKIALSHALSSIVWSGLILLLYARFRSSDRSPRALFLFALYWFCVWLIPQSAFIFPQIMADHFLYLSSAGACVVLSSAISVYSKGRRRFYILGALALWFGAFSFIYSGQWRDEKRFFLRTARLSPYSYRAHDSLAALYVSEGRFDEALQEYRTILFLDGKGGAQKKKLTGAVFYNMGVVFSAQGHDGQARDAYEAALRMDPLKKEALNNLGLYYAKQADFQKAEEHYRRSIAIDGHFVSAYNNLAALLAGEGRLEEAVRIWEQVLVIDPGYEGALYNIRIAQELIRDKNSLEKR